MSNCLSFKQIEEYGTGAGSPDQRVATAAHLDECPTCRAQFAEHQAKETLLAEVRRVQSQAAANAPAADAEVGDRIPGYEILEEIHRGGQGVVYKVIQRSTERVVAIKMLRGGPLASEAALKRFEREVKLAAALRHPNIVTIHDSGIIDGCPYVVMDHVGGVRITEYAAVRGLSIGDRLKLFATVCAAVGHAHEHGVIHRDLKPSNILVNEQGEPVIVDFGLARTVRPDQQAPSGDVTAPGQVLGSLPYLSPEQAAGDPTETDERTDVYSLGALLYELLTGRLPPPVTIPSADGASPSACVRPLPPTQVCVGLDQRLDALVLEALERDKKRRYRSAGDLAAVTRMYLEQPGTLAGPAWRRVLRRAPVAAVLTYALATTAVIVDLLRRPPIPPDLVRYPGMTTPERPLPRYHGHRDTPCGGFPLTFEGGRYHWGLNPRDWEHLEGPNGPASEGLSNLFLTGFWRATGERALRSKTGTGRSCRIDALDVRECLNGADRFYYQCWLHLEGTAEDCAQIGFVMPAPLHTSDASYQPFWTNSVAFREFGLIEWYADAPDGRRLEVLGRWPQGQPFVCFVRVEIDFATGSANVWVNGEPRGADLPATPKEFTIPLLPGQRFRVERWGLAAPGGHPPLYTGHKLYQPRWVDIDDLEIGTWEYTAPASGRPPDDAPAESATDSSPSTP